MKSILALGLFALAAAPAAYSAPADLAPVVSVTGGKVQGVVENGISIWRGVPFAQPPVGDLRWRAPQPVKAWTGIKTTDKFVHDCSQVANAGDEAPSTVSFSEDCLYLNVWRPAGAISGKKLPVIVWIYGGGMTTGGTSPVTYDGSSFARQGVIYVSLNYRLGRFGFFTHPALTKANADGGLLGNYGFMDQIAALKWVKSNIAAFGGDPANVTIFGESAGGVSVNMFMTSPLASGLFQKAIVESGGGRTVMQPAKPMHGDTGSADADSVTFAKNNGIEGDDAAALVKLRALPESVINSAKLRNSIMVDGKILPTWVDQAFAAGKQAKVPFIVGSNSADLGLGGPRGATKDALFENFGSAASLAKTAYDPNGDAAVQAITTQAGMDFAMAEPARFLARSMVKAGEPTYYFRFSYLAETRRNGRAGAGAPHATEIPYVMDTVKAKYGDKATQADIDVGKAANAYWVNFAKTGNPNGSGLPQWDAYRVGDEKMMNFTSAGSPVLETDSLKTRLDAAEALANKPKP